MSADASPAVPATDRYSAIAEEARAIRGVSLARDAWRRLRRRPAPMIALFVLVTLGLLAVFTPLLPLAPPNAVDTHRYLQPPNATPFWRDAAWVEGDRIDWRKVSDGFGPMRKGEASGAPRHSINSRLLTARVAIFGDREIAPLCGTDQLGRDVMSRLFWGARISLMVGIVAALVSLVIGVTYGAVSGFLGGRVDSAMMRGVDVLYSLPLIFIVILLLTVVNPSTPAPTPGKPAAPQSAADESRVNRMTIFMLTVGATYWLTMSRVVRGQVISLKHEQFIEAARVIGASRARIIFFHVVPNIFSIIIVYLTLTIPRVMLFEAFLSFLGLGVESPDVSWGIMASEGMREITPLGTHAWMVLPPGLALGITLFALNFLGDGLRDALDPRLRNR